MGWIPYLVSLWIGLGAGVAYGLIRVRSPAPPPPGHPTEIPNG
ncbi:MAG: DUF1427 family protein [Pseudomonadota bacterium]